MYKPVSVCPLSEEQCRRLIKGQGVRIKKGSGNTLYLTDRQIKYLDKADMKKNGGYTIYMDPYQAEQHKILKKGGSLKPFKSLGKNLKKTFNKDLGRDVANVGKIAGRHFIEEGLPIASTLLGTAIGGPAGAILGNAVGNISAEYASNAYNKEVEGKGLFKMMHKAGIKNPKKKLIGGLKDVGRATAQIGSQMIGDSIAMYTGNPELGNAFTQNANMLAQTAIDKNLKQSIRQAKNLGRNELKQYAENFAIEAVDDYVDKNLTGNQKRMAENLIAGRYPNASEFVFDMANMATGTDYRPQTGKGIRRKKKGGALAPAGRRGGALGPAR